jgi:predicted N-acetyltransferase YhbS
MALPRCGLSTSDPSGSGARLHAAPERNGQKERIMVTIREEKIADIAAREALLDEAYGATRFAKASERLREGRLPADGLSLVAADRGRLIGTIRLWNISAGPGRDAVLLGPLAVHPSHRNRGIGSALMRRAIARARLAGHGAILLVGDLAYYGRFGFSAAPTGELWMPGRYERDRLLALELAPNALAGSRGLIGATGRLAPKPDLNTLIGAYDGKPRPLAKQAA